jgi:hypothetical protein
MTKLLKQAFDEVSKLDGDEQDSLARWLLEELASERRRDTAFQRSPDQLRKLADEALGEYRAGRSQPLDPSAL